MRTRKRGGRIIGEGKIAEIYYPAIPCKDGRDMTHKVLRVVKKIKRYKNNLSIGYPIITILNEIDPKQKYFIYPETCEYGDLLPENIEDGLTDEDKEFSEIMNKGGQQWRDIEPTQKQTKYLLAGVKKLHNAGIVHTDIHRRNIIIGDDGMPRIIDFDRAIVNATQEIIDLEDDFINKFFVRNIRPPGLLIRFREKVRKILMEQKK
jgi:RIO-like serine/threonine protein kinase